MLLKQVLLQVNCCFYSDVKPISVGSVKFAHGDISHAMILDNVRDKQFIFKNTYSYKKKFIIQVDDLDSPDEFFFVHVELTDEKIAEALNSQQQVAIRQQTSLVSLHSKFTQTLERSTPSSPRQSKRSKKQTVPFQASISGP